MMKLEQYIRSIIRRYKPGNAICGYLHQLIEIPAPAIRATAKNYIPDLDGISKKKEVCSHDAPARMFSTSCRA